MPLVIKWSTTNFKSTLKIHKYNKMIKKFDKYKTNLTRVKNDIYSYSTKVATIDKDNLMQLGYWSVTTQKHINYVAKELNLTLIK